MNQFAMKTKIYMGPSSLEGLKDLPIKRSFLICDPFMVQSGMIERLTEILQETGRAYDIFSDVVPDPTIDVVSKTIKQMKSFKPDSIIAFGGGSAIDTAKAANKVYSRMGNESLYLVAIPTTSGTGSEVTNFSVISDPNAQAKYALRSEEMLPDVAFLDPGFTESVPAHITADCGMDVLTHALEAYASIQANDFTDACAEKAIKLVSDYLVETVKDGKNIEARAYMHSASCLAGIAFNGASLGICHSMAHALGARFYIPHGRSNAMLLTHVISYNAGLMDDSNQEVCARYAYIANMLGLGAGTEKATVHGLVRYIKNMMKKMNIPVYVTDLKIDPEEYKEAIQEMAEKAMADACTATNPRKPSQGEIEAIYGMLCKGGSR